jgi:phosphohistidine phosphatase
VHHSPAWQTAFVPVRNFTTFTSLKIFLLRHAEAEVNHVSDYNRALTEKGEAQARKVGKFCAAQGIIPEVIFASPLVRAEATAQLAAKELPGVEVIVAPWLASGMQPEFALDELRALTQFSSVMLVGHEPDFSLLVSALLGIPSGYGINVRKASLTALQADILRFGAAVLDFSVPVKFM